MAATVARGRPRSAEVDERILNSALDHLRAHGYRDLSIEQVAADAGVSKATVYRRYRDRADLASAALAVVSAAKLGPDLPDGTREALVELLGRLVLERGQERGEIRADADLDAALLMLFGALFARRLSGDRSAHWRERVVDELLRGLAAG
jgi:AcrR family transcriptional regulator